MNGKHTFRNVIILTEIKRLNSEEDKFEIEKPTLIGLMQGRESECGGRDSFH